MYLALQFNSYLTYPKKDSIKAQKYTTDKYWILKVRSHRLLRFGAMLQLNMLSL